MARTDETVRIDSQILRCIGQCGADCATITLRMIRKFGVRGPRTIDRGLQRLRRAGKIRYLGGSGRLWTVV